MWRKLVSKVPRRVARGTRMVLATCFTAFLAFLFMLKIEALVSSQTTHGNPKTLYAPMKNEKARPSFHRKPPLYEGPYHRYTLQNGTWTRFSGPSDAIKGYYSRKPPPIPHIIHQTWDTENIPQHFVPWVLSWLRHHPDWEYWFWTPNDVINFLHKDYSSSVKVYEQYKLMLSRADAMRYFVLHSFGGVYADLDTECLRPFDDLTYEFPCILTEETYEHAHLLYKKNPANMMTTIMACRPTHPLFLLAIRGLSFTQNRYPNDVLRSTGPLYLDTIFRHYTKKIPKTVGSYVKVLPPDYFMPTYDSSQSLSFERACHQATAQSPDYIKDTCRRWDSHRRAHNGPSANSYATHYWVHVILKEKKWKEMKAVSVQEAINTKTNGKMTSGQAQDSFVDVQNKKEQLKYRHSKRKGVLMYDKRGH